MLPTYMKMIPESKVKWLAALRSGEYAQTIGMLHSLSGVADVSAGYCCLGVACEVAIADGVVMTRETHTTDEDGTVERFNSHTGTAPDALQVWMFGADLSRDEQYAVSQTLQRLMRMNDVEHASLDEIADWVEEHL